MPWWLVLILVLHLVSLLVLVLRLRVSFTYKKDVFTIKAHLAFFSYTLYPGKGRGLTAELIGFILKLLFTILPYLRITVARMHIRVATGDAATTATLYGTASAGLSALLATLDHLLELDPKTRHMSLFADYLSDKPSFDLNIILSTPLIRALVLLLPLVLDAVKAKKEEKTAGGEAETKDEAAAPDKEPLPKEESNAEIPA